MEILAVMVGFTHRYGHFRTLTSPAPHN